MRKLIIHAGLHKTGTSSLQEYLSHHRVKYLEDGINFYSPGSSGNSSKLIHVSINNDTIDAKPSTKIINDLLSVEGDTVIVSAEYLSFVTSESSIENFKSLFSVFDDIKVVFYLRRQNELALSFKAQASKCEYRGAMPSSLLLGHSDQPYPDVNNNIKEYFDYSKKLKIWANIFGYDNIVCKVYDKYRMYKGDICKDFCHAFGLKYYTYDFQHNASFPRRKAVISNIFLQANSPKKLLTFVRKNISGLDEPISSNKAQAIKFYSHFITSNQRLVEEGYLLELWSDNFDSYSEDYKYFVNSDLIEANRIMDKYIKSCSTSNQELNLLSKIPLKNIYTSQRITNSERIRYYLGDVENFDKELFQEVKAIKPKFKYVHDSMFLFDIESIDKNQVPGSYYSDIKRLLTYLTVNHVYALFGDKQLQANLPALVKTRLVSNGYGVLANLNSSRHWDYDLLLDIYSNDVSWESKSDTVVWRGATTGYTGERFDFVKKYSDSYDVGFSKIVQSMHKAEEFLKQELSIHQQLNYKFVICLEGNDVATNLKWVLASNSIPIMRKPKFSSWLMEDNLIPFFHYLPLDDDYENLNEILQWAEDNSTWCKRIAENGKLYILNFLDKNNEAALEKKLMASFEMIVSEDKI